MREGWDNPNVFTICKLRSSGSEISKIQEVGRGLRLPVDEVGNRLCNNEWYLNFVVGDNEKDFCDKLKAEINATKRIVLNEYTLTPTVIKEICNIKNTDEKTLLNYLGDNDIIDYARNFKEGGFDKLLKYCPQLLQTQLQKGKVKNHGENNDKVKLKKENWEKIKDFWKAILSRYMIRFNDDVNDKKIEELFTRLLKNSDVFSDNKQLTVTKNTLKTNESGDVTFLQSQEGLNNKDYLGTLKYNEFVKVLATRLDIPLQIIHRVLWERLKEFLKTGEDLNAINKRLNWETVNKIIAAWDNLFNKEFSVAYTYDKLNFTANVKILDYNKAAGRGVMEFVDDLPTGDLGVIKDDTINTNLSKQLYELPLYYDSEDPERDILCYDIEKTNVKVFGKVPSRAIKIPKITGGSSTPDFIYAIQKQDNEYLYILLEAKSTDIRKSESVTLKAQEKFFNGFPNIEYHKVTSLNEVIEILQKY